MTPGPATPASVHEVVHLLRPLVLQVARVLDGRLVAHRLTPGACAALEFLAENGPQTVPDIARRWTLGRQNVQRVADALIARGLVERVENPGHRRSMRLCLTPDGVALFRALRTEEQDLIAALTPGLGQDDVESCRRVLQHLHAGFRFSGRGGTRIPTEFSPVGANRIPSAPSGSTTTDGTT